MARSAKLCRGKMADGSMMGAQAAYSQDFFGAFEGWGDDDNDDGGGGALPPWQTVPGG